MKKKEEIQAGDNHVHIEQVLAVAPAARAGDNFTIDQVGTGGDENPILVRSMR